MKAPLTSLNQRTYEVICEHPIARNLHWRDARAMYSELGEVTEEQHSNRSDRGRRRGTGLSAAWSPRILKMHT